MYDFMLNTEIFILFVVAPILTITLIVRFLKKKPIKRVLQALGMSVIYFIVLAIIAIFTVPEDMATEMQTTTEQVETTAKIQEPTTKEPPTTTVPQNTMIEQFKSLGFTQAEAEEMKEIFATVGITKISNIRSAVGDGIDKLQTFKCDIFDYHRDKGGVSVHFTIDKRQLCFISLDGIPTTKADYAYINIFGNVKVKTSNTTKSVTLYDKWDENGEIDENSVGYKAVFDYENKKIENYKQ